MGSGSRGQLRPHFAGRSPPFLVAALCIGICVLAVSYYTLSTQSSSTEAKLALSLQKNQDITSELETCRSQLHAKEQDFDQVKTELEHLKKQLISSEESIAAKDKELREVKSQSVQQKADLDQCRTSESKLKSDSKTLDDVNSQWKEKEEKWLKEKNDLEAEAAGLRAQLKKKPATDEVSNNNDDEKISSGGKVVPDAGVADAGKSVLAAAVVPAVEENAAAPAVVPAPKPKDEIGSDTL